MSLERKYADLAVFREPRCLVDTGAGHGLQISEEVLEELRLVEEEMVIVGIAGPYRTGKSYLMNRLANRKTGFSLGSTIQAHTKGIWVWCRPHPEHPDQVLVLMDTEGLGDVEKGSLEHDVWILTLAVLLSSTLVYNILSVMNEDAMTEINMVAVISKKLLASVQADAAFQEFPIFVLSLRDFTLELELNGVEITADEYLDNCLSLTQVSEGASATNTSDRKAIIECFPRRKCFTFDRPGNKKVLRELDSLPDSELDDEFVKQSEEFCKFIYTNSPAKHLTAQQTVNGPRFVELLRNYVSVVAGGGMPSIRGAVEAMSRIENTRAVEGAVTEYLSLMTETITLPTADSGSLQEVHNFCASQAVLQFNKKAILDDDGEFITKLMVRLCIELQTFEAMNTQSSEERCRYALTELNRHIEDKLRQGVYARPRGFLEYQQDVDRLVEEYQLQPELGLQAVAELGSFINNKQMEGQMVMNVDIHMRKQAVRTAELEAEVEEYRRRTRAAERQSRDAERRQEELRQLLLQRVEEEERQRQQSLSSLNEQMDRHMQQQLAQQRDRLNREGNAQLESLRRQLR